MSKGIGYLMMSLLFSLKADHIQAKTTLDLGFVAFWTLLALGFAVAGLIEKE